ncbi:unnamed protein product [Prorocentrum cordatum]|uniref:Glycosyl hydrolase family 32 C-terminal domain-containing protein n=1 Tax=Prorocentrum cordatum TaxID=2364126 RepID=A0ABN9RZJ1_9DINO|nr:unnamed protein product [Polarella glacialis]
MNDPNGLQWRRLQGGQLSYEMFHQLGAGQVSEAAYIALVPATDGGPARQRGAAPGLLPPTASSACQWGRGRGGGQRHGRRLHSGHDPRDLHSRNRGAGVHLARVARKTLTNSLWITGAASRREGELYKFHEERFNGNPSRGPVDVGGGTHCGQSMWDAKGRRIQFMWLKLNLPGANWTGAQTIPREIALAPAGSSSGLLFKPIVEMATLHASVEPAINEAFETGARRVFSPPDGLHCHVKANLTLQEGSAVAITVRDSEGDMADAHGSLLISAQLQNGEYTVVFGEASVQVSLPGSLRLEIFVDGPVVELFVNGGERVLTTNSGNPQYISDTKLSVEGNGVAATVTLQVWSMAQAVSGPGDHQVVV